MAQLHRNIKYTKEEREMHELSILGGMSNSIGFVKFKELLDAISPEMKFNLEQIGIYSDDIIVIYSSIVSPRMNAFVSKETRKLPLSTIIETDLTNTNVDIFLINFNKRRIANGYKLTPEEEYENIGINLNINGIDIELIDDESLIDVRSGKLKEPILYHYLMSKQRNNSLTSEEFKTLIGITSKYINEQSNVIHREIKKSLHNMKQLSEYQTQLDLLTEYLFGFRSKRYTNSKFPIWIDLERFVHILIRHVKEVDFGSGFEDKSKFQYIIFDIHRLIGIVLESIDSEIQNHFLENPNKPFKRHGKMCSYFNGDYYVIDIAENGKLMTFYKRK